MADKEKLSGYKISTDTAQNAYTLKDVKCFRNGLVCEPYEISLYE